MTTRTKTAKIAILTKNSFPEPFFRFFVGALLCCWIQKTEMDNGTPFVVCGGPHTRDEPLGEQYHDREQLSAMCFASRTSVLQ